MHIVFRFFTILALGLAASSCNRPSKAGDSQATELEGDWLVESWTIDGNSVPVGVREGAKLIIRGRTAEFRSPLRTVKSTFTADPAIRPKTLDVTITEGASRGKTLLGIYELEDNTLKNCHAGSDVKRPSQFSADAGSGQSLIVYKRATRRSET